MMKTFIINKIGLTIITVLLLWSGHLQARLLSVEDSLLMKLYNRTDGPNWTNIDNWLVPGQPVISWYGIFLQDQGQGLGIDVNLPNNNLTRVLTNPGIPRKYVNTETVFDYDPCASPWSTITGLKYDVGTRSLVKEETMPTGWNTVAYSGDVLPAYENGSIEFIIEANTADRFIVGLTQNSQTKGGTNFSDVGYGIMVTHLSIVRKNIVEIYNNGVHLSMPGLTTAEPGDVFKIERTLNSAIGKITFYKNGYIITTIGVSKAVVADEMVLHVSLFDSDAQVDNLVSSWFQNLIPASNE